MRMRIENDKKKCKLHIHDFVIDTLRRAEKKIEKNCEEKMKEIIAAICIRLNGDRNRHIRHHCSSSGASAQNNQHSKRIFFKIKLKSDMISWNWHSYWNFLLWKTASIVMKMWKFIRAFSIISSVDILIDSIRCNVCRFRCTFESFAMYSAIRDCCCCLSLSSSSPSSHCRQFDTETQMIHKQQKQNIIVKYLLNRLSPNNRQHNITKMERQGEKK